MAPVLVENSGQYRRRPGSLAAGVILVLAVLLPGCVPQPAPLETPDLDRFSEELAMIASEPRVPGQPHHQAVQNLCAGTFAQLGFEVELQAFPQGVNVIGVLPGGDRAAERVLVSAHYDTIPGCSGADDNASGVARVLESARLLAGKYYDRTLVLACWDTEERGLLGSRAFAARAAEEGSQIVMMYNFEMIGYRSLEPGSQAQPDGAAAGTGDYIALIHDEASAAAVQAIVARAQLLDLPTRTLPVDLSTAYPRDYRRSDHAPFWDEGYAAVMITDTANFRNPNYHCLQGEDAYATLDLDFAIRVVESVVFSVDLVLSGLDLEP